MKTFQLIFYTLLACFLFYALAYGDPLVVAPILPDPYRTPGVTDKEVTMEKVCLSGYSESIRNVSDKTKRQVLELYGLNFSKDKFEIDHLISLELGGTNDVQNLWPQSYTSQPWNAHVKDKLENRLHREVCDGIITVDEAQLLISNDWIKTYCEKYDDMQEQCNVYLNKEKNK